MLKKLVINSAFKFISNLIADKVKDEDVKILLSMLLMTAQKVVDILVDGNKADNKEQISEVIKKDLEVLGEAVSRVI